MSIIVYFIDHIDKIYRFTVSHLALISIAMFFFLITLGVGRGYYQK